MNSINRSLKSKTNIRNTIRSQTIITKSKKQILKNNYSHINDNNNNSNNNLNYNKLKIKRENAKLSCPIKKTNMNRDNEFMKISIEHKRASVNNLKCNFNSNKLLESSNLKFKNRQRFIHGKKRFANLIKNKNNLDYFNLNEITDNIITELKKSNMLVSKIKSFELGKIRRSNFLVKLFMKLDGFKDFINRHQLYYDKNAVLSSMEFFDLEYFNKENYDVNADKGVKNNFMLLNLQKKKDDNLNIKHNININNVEKNIQSKRSLLFSYGDQTKYFFGILKGSVDLYKVKIEYRNYCYDYRQLNFSKIKNKLDSCKNIASNRSSEFKKFLSCLNINNRKEIEIHINRLSSIALDTNGKYASKSKLKPLINIIYESNKEIINLKNQNDEYYKYLSKKNIKNLNPENTNNMLFEDNDFLKYIEYDIITKRDYISMNKKDQSKVIKVVNYIYSNTLKSGDFYGDWDIISNKTRSTRAYISEDGILAVLPSNQFTSCFGVIYCIILIYFIYKSKIYKTHLEYKRLLADIILPFKNLLVKSIEILYKCIIIKSCKFNEIIYRENNNADKLYFILSGCFQLHNNIHSCTNINDKELIKKSNKQIISCILEKNEVAGLESVINSFNNNTLQNSLKYSSTFICKSRSGIYIEINPNKLDYNTLHDLNKLMINWHSIRNNLISKKIKNYINNKENLKIEYKLNYKILNNTFYNYKQHKTKQLINMSFSKLKKSIKKNTSNLNYNINKKLLENTTLNKVYEKTIDLSKQNIDINDKTNNNNYNIINNKRLFSSCNIRPKTYNINSVVLLNNNSIKEDKLINKKNIKKLLFYDKLEKDILKNNKAINKNNIIENIKFNNNKNNINLDLENNFKDNKTTFYTDRVKTDKFKSIDFNAKDTYKKSRFNNFSSTFYKSESEMKPTKIYLKETINKNIKQWKILNNFLKSNNNSANLNTFNENIKDTSNTLKTLINKKPINAINNILNSKINNNNNYNNNKHCKKVSIISDIKYNYTDRIHSANKLLPPKVNTGKFNMAFVSCLSKT